MKDQETPKLLTKEDVCLMLRVSPRNLGYMVAQSRFPQPVRIGKRCYWAAAAINRWQAMQCEVQMNWLPIAA